MKLKLIVTLFLLVLMPLVVFAINLNGTNYNMPTIVADSGGAKVISDDYKTDITTGEVTGAVNSTNYNYYMGYWYTTIADVTDPVVEFAGGTATDESRVWETYIYVNVTVTEENFRSITFSLRNSTATVNTTTYGTEIYSINWTNLSGEDYWYNVTVEDIASNTGTVSRKITLLESEFNVTLNKGWNLISLSLENTEAGTDRNITVVAGKNLISYSSSTPVSVGNILFTDSDGNQSTWANALAANKMYGYFAYISNTSTKANKDWDYAAPSYMPVSDDVQLREGRGYDFHALENGTLTLPLVGGTVNGTTYNWADLRFQHSNGTQLNITDVSSAGWVLPDDNSHREFIVYYDTSTGLNRYVCSSVGRTAPDPNCKSTTLNSWQGYYIWSEYDNITLIRDN